MPYTQSKIPEPNVKDIIKLLDNTSESDVELITRAYEFAKKAHEGYCSS